jgi:AcrR family transcriptional regulator
MQPDCNAVRLHFMTRGVNPNTQARRADRIAGTEERLIAAATRLFVRNGYAATTLATVAAEAGVAARTVYVRFGTKAALLKRAVDVAVVGDHAPVDVTGRDWMHRAMTAPTLDERIAAFAHGSTDIMRRAGALFEVARQAEPVEPLIAEAARAGREATRDHIRTLWTVARRDGLLPPRTRVTWLAETTALLCADQTYLLATRTLGWETDHYGRWLRETLHRLVTAAA